MAFWEQIAAGLLPEEACGVIGVAPAVGARWFRNAGGMPPFDLTLTPTGRYLSFVEREEIALLRAQGEGVREIARRIGRADILAVTFGRGVGRWRASSWPTNIRELVELKLLDGRHDVAVAVDGPSALAAVRADRPDLLLLDVSMAGMSGLEVLTAVRADADLAGLAVIMLTARAGDDDVEASLRAGVDDYVTKPFSPRDLAARVETMLTSRRR